MLYTYFFGCWWLPCALTYINADVVQLGKYRETNSIVVDNVEESPAETTGPIDATPNSVEKEQPNEPDADSVDDDGMWSTNLSL